MKKKYWAMILLGSALVLGGCSKGTETETQNTVSSEAGTEIQDTVSSEAGTEIQDTVSSEAGTEIQDTVSSEAGTEKGDSEEKLNLEDYSLEYQADTDAQPYFAWTRMAKSENGYYLWDSRFMMFFDPASERIVPLCNRPDCLHNSSDCNAFFNTFSGDGDKYMGDMVSFTEGNLYLVGLDEEDSVNLYKVSPDGSSREKYMQLYKADISRTTDGDYSSEGFAYPDVCIHRGYVYFIINDEKPRKIRRIKLGTAETEIVYEPAGERGSVYRMEGYGDYLFFQAGNFAEDYIEIDGGIYAYNIETGTVQLVKKDAINIYIMADGIIYYAQNGTSIHAFSLASQEDRIELEESEGWDEFTADASYIYILKDDVLRIYSHEGELVNQVEEEGTHELFGGDGEYLLANRYERSMDGGGIEHFMVIRISELEEENLKWTYIN